MYFEKKKKAYEKTIYKKSNSLKSLHPTHQK